MLNPTTCYNETDLCIGFVSAAFPSAPLSFKETGVATLYKLDTDRIGPRGELAVLDFSLTRHHQCNCSHGRRPFGLCSIWTD
jgi:hypothetical protein